MQRIFSSLFRAGLHKQQARFSEMNKFQHTFLTTTNLPYIEALF